MAGEFIQIFIYHFTWDIKQWKEWALFPQGDNWSAEFFSFVEQLDSAMMFIFMN